MSKLLTSDHFIERAKNGEKPATTWLLGEIDDGSLIVRGWYGGLWVKRSSLNMADSGAWRTSHNWEFKFKQPAITLGDEPIAYIAATLAEEYCLSEHIKPLFARERDELARIKEEHRRLYDALGRLLDAIDGPFVEDVRDSVGSDVIDEAATVHNSIANPNYAPGQGE